MIPRASCRRPIVLVLVLVLVLAFALGGCDEESTDASRTATTSAPAKKTARRQRRLRPRDLPIPKRRVAFATSDGVEIVAWLYPTRDRTAPGVVLVHQLSSNRDEWGALVQRLRALGRVSILSIDMRGHGESTKMGEETLAWRAFGPAEWRGIVGDVRAALRWLQEGTELRPSKIGLVGSSIGSSAVLIAASDDATVDAVVMLSPGVSYRGLDILDSARRYGQRPLLLMATEGDTRSAESVDAIAEVAVRADYHVYREGTAHGVAIAEEAPDLFRRVAAWMAGKLGISRPDHGKRPAR